MKIIQLTTFFYPVHGGVEQMVLQLSKRLQKIGHRVTIITSDSAKSGKKIRPFNEMIEGIPVKRCRTWFSLSYFHKFFPSVILKLLSTDFDIIHVQGIRKFESYAALLVAKIKRKKVIISTHNPFIIDPKERSFLSKILIALHDITFGIVFLRFFDHFITLAPNEYAHLKKFGVKKYKISTIPNAVPDMLWQEAHPEKVTKKYAIPTDQYDATVLSLGRISRRKGLQNLEAAIKQLPKTLFLLCGPDDGYVPTLKKIFEGNSNVLFTGAIPREETKDFYALADIFVMPSLYEPFGVVLIEAMAKGLPVIATNVGGPISIVKKEFGFLVDPTDQKHIAKYISFLVDNPQKRDEMGNAAKIEAQKYAWNTIIIKYNEIYKNLFKKP